MIQNIYSDEKLKSCKNINQNMQFKMPKNIRQVGQVSTTKKIYAEDYVMTYMKQLAEKMVQDERKAILLGRYIRVDGTINVFINGAVEIVSEEGSRDGRISSEAWTEITNCINKYYTDVEIVGWYITKKESPIEVNESITRMHLDNFAGYDKTLLVYDAIEKEEGFYFYEQGELKRQPGYYIYYDRNEQMQNYMIETKKPESTDAGYTDTTTQKIRTIIEAKNEEKHLSGLAPFAYTAGSLIAVVFLVIGATMVNNDGNSGNVVNVMTNNAVSSVETEKEEKTDEKNANEELVTQVDSVKSNLGKDNSIGFNTSVLIDDSKINEKDVEGMLKENEAISVSADGKGQNEEKAKINEAGQGAESESKNQGKSTDKQVGDKNHNQEEKKEQTAIHKPTSIEGKKEQTPSESSKKDVQKELSVKKYVVKKGDTLVDISYQIYGTILYVEKLKEQNHIANENLIYEGQVLVLPQK